MAESGIQEIIVQHQRNIYRKRSRDGFESGDLRSSIIAAVSELNLPKEPPPGMYKNLTDKEKIKVFYLLECGRIGARLCRDYLNRNFRQSGECCYQEIILAGASEIGNDMAVEYGRSFYPERLKMHEQGIEPEPPKPPVIETPAQDTCFGFTVHTYDSYFDISKFSSMPPSGFLIDYDEVNERYIETYSFRNKQHAQNARRKWILFINERIQEPPVKYGFEVDGENISSVIPLDNCVTPIVPYDKLRLFDTLKEAIRSHQEIKAGNMVEIPASQPEPPDSKRVRRNTPEAVAGKEKSRLDK